MRNREVGASLAEFLVAAPLVLLIGLATLQTGLIYHGKTTLNYAVFEAARTGAVQNARVSAMREELGQRLAPVHGGDASEERLVASLASSARDSVDVSTTDVRILNPSLEAFDDWGVAGTTINQRVIPNVHLRHKSEVVGPSSGLTIQDANLLKIHIVYGLDMNVPVVGELIAEVMQRIDTKNTHYYQRKKFPINAVATVRMQSEAWESEVLASLAPNLAPVNDESETHQDEGGAGNGEEPSSSDSDVLTNLPDADCDGGEFGLGGITELINTSDYLDQQCTVSTQAFTPVLPEAEQTGADHTDCV